MKPQWPSWVVWLCALVALGVLLAGKVWAHDPEHRDLSDWYSHLNGRGPCCDGSDTEMKHVAEADWEVKDGHYRVRINQYMDNSGEWVWVDVPDDAVIKEPNKDGRTLVWPIWGTHPQIRCFMPGAGM